MHIEKIRVGEMQMLTWMCEKNLQRSNSQQHYKLHIVIPCHFTKVLKKDVVDIQERRLTQ